LSALREPTGRIVTSVSHGKQLMAHADSVMGTPEELHTRGLFDLSDLASALRDASQDTIRKAFEDACTKPIRPPSMGTNGHKSRFRGTVLLCLRGLAAQKTTTLQAFSSGRGPTRTGDPLGVNEVLWPTELRAPCPGFWSPKG
jgi:hypothetical protein